MLLFTLCSLLSIAAGGRTKRNLQLPLSNDHGWPTAPGNSIVKLCPGSHENDILAIDRITNNPEKPYLNEGIQVFIDGNFTKPVSPASTVDWEVIAVTNGGEAGQRTGTFNICSYMEEMRQPPDSKIEKSCPPKKGPVMIDYMMWFANFIFAPGRWIVKFHAKTPERAQIYCLVAEFDLQCLPDYEGPECRRESGAMKEFGIDDLFRQSRRGAT